MDESKIAPLAKTRTRRSNAGARMHQMMFAAEEDELLAQAFGLVKADEDSSDDEEYVPKYLEANEGDIDIDDDGDEDGSSDSGSSSDEDEEEDEDEENEDEEEERIVCLDDISGDVKPKPTKIEVKSESTNGEARTRPKPGSPTKSAYGACSKICSVCLGDQSDDDDEVIECDSCGVSVHETCYGTSGEENQDEDHISIHSNISSESTEPWFCEPCRRSVKNPHCELCPNQGGIFKETDSGRWVHMVCALYTRGVTFENIDSLTTVSLFELNYSLYGSKVRLLKKIHCL